METYKPTPGPPSVAVILNPALYKFGQFIGMHIVSPIQKEIPDFGRQLISIQAFQLANKKKVPKSQLMPHIKETLDFCDVQGIHTIICANAQYFEVLTKQKFTPSLGMVKPCVFPEYSHISVIPLMSPAILQQYPNKRPMVQKCLNTVIKHLKGEYSDVKAEVETYELLTDPKDIQNKLEYLQQFDMLAWDIETTGLKHATSDIITHAFGVSETEAYTIVCHPKYTKENAQDIHKLLQEFFATYKGTLLIHNVGFESKFYAWKYFMSSWDDYENMYKAINNMKFEDTMLLAKAARNSVDREPYGLKELAADKFGDWDADINVKKAIEEPIEKLAYYNAIDVCATWYVWNTLNKEIGLQQKQFYDTIMKDIQRLFSKIMLTGLPVHMPTVLKVEQQLRAELSEVESVFFNNSYVKLAEERLHYLLAEKYNATHKVKRKSPLDFEDVKLNYKSSTQKRMLLFEVMGYEPLEFSEDTGEPKADKDTIFEYLHAELDEEKKEVLECLTAFSQITIILDNFINAFRRDSIEVSPGHHRLYGNLVNAGAISARPTSNQPNLLNMPSGSKYGKLIKQCFRAREGYVIMQADYAALQSRTGAYISGAKNLIRILNEDIDSHSFHAARYFKDEIDDFEDTKEYYEAFAKVHKDLRQKSKGVTFSMQYGAGAEKVQKLLKCDAMYAQQVVHTFHHELYPEMHELNERIGLQAQKEGIIHLGMGWHLRTESARSKSKEIAAKAKRSAANAVVQFWDILTLLALRDFQSLVETEGYINKVIIHATVYDSIYMEVVDDTKVISWVNQNLTKCMVDALEYMKEDLKRPSPIILAANTELGETWVSLVEFENDDTEQEIEEKTLKALLDKEFK